MKTTTHYPFGDKAGGCNGLTLDNKNHVLFAACARSGNPADNPPMPRMVILSATDVECVSRGERGPSRRR